MPPFLLGEPYGDARMGLARIFGVCAAFLFASSLGAAEIIDLGPSDYRRWGTGTNTHTLEGLRSSIGQTVRIPPVNGNLNVNRNAVIPYGSIANGMRNFVRINPGSLAASAAVTGLFLAVDWVFDQASGEWRKTGVLDEIDTEGYQWAKPSNFNDLFPTPELACQSMAYHSPYVIGAYKRLEMLADGDASCVYEDARYPSREKTYISRRFGGGCSEGFTYEVVDGNAGCFKRGLVPLNSSDWGDLESSLPAASSSEVGTAGHDTQRLTGAPLPGYQDQAITGPSSVSGPETTSTSTDPVTGDTVVTTSSTTTNITYGDTTITTSNTTVTNTYTNGQHTGSETTTETPGELPVTGGGGGGVADWPKFCDWATVVCDWLDWTQEDPPPEQELPAVIDDDFFEEKRISFGAKSCPPDHQIDLAPFLDTTVGVSFQPLCDFAGLIYYMVMAASYIIAAYISIGVARNA